MCWGQPDVILPCLNPKGLLVSSIISVHEFKVDTAKCVTNFQK